MRIWYIIGNAGGEPQRQVGTPTAQTRRIVPFAVSDRRAAQRTHLPLCPLRLSDPQRAAPKALFYGENQVRTIPPRNHTHSLKIEPDTAAQHSRYCQRGHGHERVRVGINKAHGRIGEGLNPSKPSNKSQRHPQGGAAGEGTKHENIDADAHHARSIIKYEQTSKRHPKWLNPPQQLNQTVSQPTRSDIGTTQSQSKETPTQKISLTQRSGNSSNRDTTHTQRITKISSNSSPTNLLKIHTIDTKQGRQRPERKRKSRKSQIQYQQ